MIDVPGDSTGRWTRRGVLALAGGTGFVLAGCLEQDGMGADDGETGSEADDSGAGGETNGGDETGGEDDGEPVDWRSESLVDVTTDESFTIDEFDRPVLLHTFAIWCGTCQRQHGEFGSLLDGTAEDPVVVELNIDPNENADAVREHAERHGFDWRFAVSPAHVSEALVEEFGSRVVSAPQSPVILICSDGDTHVLDKVVSDTDLADALESRCS